MYIYIIQHLTKIKIYYTITYEFIDKKIIDIY